MICNGVRLTTGLVTAHTHLHLHHDPLAAAMGLPQPPPGSSGPNPASLHPSHPLSGFPPPGPPRPGSLTRPELIHPSLLGRPGSSIDEQNAAFAHQVNYVNDFLSNFSSVSLHLP